jgi:PEGA domain
MRLTLLLSVIIAAATITKGGEVVLTSDPPGSTILTGGKQLGTTPLTADLPPGPIENNVSFRHTGAGGSNIDSGRFPAIPDPAKAKALLETEWKAKESALAAEKQRIQYEIANSHRSDSRAMEI